MLVGKLELVFWAIGLVFMFLDLISDQKVKEYFKACLSVWPVFIFVFLALMSVSWSILKWITLFKVIILIFTTLAGIYLGFTFNSKKFLEILGWYFLFVVGFSLVYIFVPPYHGIMFQTYYKEAWRGIFWHRNYFACFLSLALALGLIRLVMNRRSFSIKNLAEAAFFVFYAFLLYKTKSATGLISALFLCGLVLLIYIWTKVQHVLKEKHYIYFGLFIMILVIFVFTNLDFLFGLLGRSTSLTGRVPMWDYLLKNIINQRPVLGYGYGAVWHFEGLRTELSKILGWGIDFPILIGDNGFVDIFLHLGVVGVLVLVGLLITAIVISIRYLIKEKTVESALPLVILGFVLVTNISLSMILESESFVWMITLAGIVIVRKRAISDKTSLSENIQSRSSLLICSD